MSIPGAVSGKVAVLVAAAGGGKRMGGARKQFRELGGKPVLVQTLFVFERHPRVDYIIVATPREAVRPLRQELKRVGITKLEGVVAGGATRQASVLAALEAMPEEVTIVLVHDAVRPFVREEQVSAVIDRVMETGAASLAVPVSDTLRRVSGNQFQETISREGLFRMQTPQGFRRDWLQEAHGRAMEDEFEATDDVELVRRIGYDVSIVAGSEDNVKITTPDDWERATTYWTVWEHILRLEDPVRHIVSGPRP